MERCPSCGREIADDAETCPHCEAQIAGPPPDDAASPVDLTIPAADTEESGLEAEILSLLRSGRKIQAVKRYREATGVGLKEAKDAVEAMAAGRGVAIRQSGCAGVVLLAVLAAGTACMAALL